MMASTIGEPAVQRFRWDVPDHAPLEHLTGFKGLHPLLVQLLWNRGIQAPDDVLSFVEGPAQLHSPWAMHGVEQAVARLVRARDRDETVAVYGDFDVDGVTSTVLLTSCLRLVGLRAEPFVPRRDVEGYGLNSLALERLRNDGATLVVAVDCGISGSREVARASELGLDVIVADHHHVPATLPNAAAVINPKQPGCTYPFKELCAVAIAYKLAQALLEHLGVGAARADEWLDLVALGTVADVVPLVGENRTLVLRGLPGLNPPTRVGLRALARRAGLSAGKIDSRAIAFGLAPRLNAAGRLADAQISVRLLLAQTETEAEALAEQLDATNRERQRLTDEAVVHARESVLGAPALPKLLLVASESYPAGVVGLVAARLVEEFWRPALVAEIADGTARGSGRGVDGFHIAAALARCGDLLLRHGGHARAAGFTLAVENLDTFRQRLQSIADQELSEEDLVPRLSVDAELHLNQFDARLTELLCRLEPFGCGNPNPLFVSRGLRVAGARVVGRSLPGHLKLKLRQGSTHWDAIGFGMADRLYSLGEVVDVVYTVERNEWNGQISTQLRLRDVRTCLA
ncbi:MAG TPA: single-stranded-DNA-specific exonuclease RecJ [Chloroflexota bacterium]|nr:single-stranded-DNA-specific exonuclease RecJ [Chloroflexota bacterium]